jgi:uncharacterized RDD family membrane protein YckC
LSVRRPTPAPGRVREKYQPAAESWHERDLLDNVELERTPAPGAAGVSPALAAAPTASRSLSEDSSIAMAGAGRRLEAACVDLLFTGGLNLAIVWLTLQRCDLTLSQLNVLPILPVAALLLLLDSLYLLMFTATNGQTIGKMAAGIRVIRDSDDAVVPDRVTLKQAAIRAIVTFPSVLALGAGFIPALVGHRLALHDRIAHTRVVRA